LDDSLLDEFRAYLAEKEFEFEAASFEEHREAIRLRLRSQIARIKWDQVEESRVLAEADPQMNRALELFGEAAELSRQGESGEPGRERRPDLRAQASAATSDEP
jgi:hypothetical protein